MIKKLDKLILKSFIGPFIATFFITLFILVMQFFWKYIDDLVGKGLDFSSILKLTAYVTATAVPLALPLSILISSIMTFGNLGESYELVAIKSAGISLVRFMRPLLVVAAIISVFAFLITNYVIPIANLKFTTMLYDIRIAKPAFDIKEGIFYNKIPGFAIKVGKKAEDGMGISNIIIYENQYSLQDNIIVAETGTMKISDDKKFLEFDLKNGWRYQEKGPYNSIQTDYYRLGFKNYKKVLDLSSFAMMKTPDSIFKGSQQMLNISQLKKSEDSLDKVTKDITDKRMYSELTTFFQFGKKFMTGWESKKFDFTKKQKKYGDLLPDSAISTSYVKASDKITMLKGSLDLITTEYTQKIRELRLFQIEWNKKFTLSIACLVLFIIGAPLGSIIRKGGLGMPLVIAVIFFLIWHLINMFGEKFVRQDLLSPITGIWMSTYLLLPIGFFLVYKAMNDSQLFNNELYLRAFRKIRAKIISKKGNTFL